MQIEIRDITPEEAAPYGGNNSAVLAGRKTVVFTDADGNSGKLYMKEEEIDVLGERYIAENSTMEYTQTLALRTGRLSSQRRQSRSLARDSFSGRAERESCLRTRSKPVPDGACISTP